MFDKKKYNQEWYQKNKESHKRNTAPRRIANRAFNYGYVVKLKSETPCRDCGKFYPYYVMDFDHVRGTKFKEIASLLAYSFATLSAEIEKCDIVCSNCHRERTYQRAGNSAVRVSDS
jgi:hypothetical protein